MKIQTMLMRIRTSTQLIIFIRLALSLSQVIQFPIFESNYTNDLSFNYYILDFTGFQYQNVQIVFTMQTIDAVFSESNYQLEATVNKLPPIFINQSTDQQTIEVGFQTNIAVTLLQFNNLKNPLYANNYQINYKVSQFESSTKYRTINPVVSSNLMSLSLSGTTGNLGSVILSIKPLFQLPIGAILQIQLPSFSTDVPSLSFIENPLFCFQGDNEVSCLMYLNKTLVIPTYASTASGPPMTDFVVWLSGFRSPASTRPFTIPLIHYVGGDNLLELMKQTNYTLSVTTASSPKSIQMISSNNKTLSLTSFTFKIQSRTYFNSQTVLNIKFPAEFGFSTFSSHLKAFDSFGDSLSLSPNNNNSSITVWNSYLPGSTDQLWMRLECVVNSVGALTTAEAFEIRVYDDLTMQYKYHEDTSSLFYTTLVNTLQIKSVSLSNLIVQRSNILSITFIFADGLSDSSLVSTRLSVIIPEEISFGDQTLAAMKSQGKIVCSTLSAYLTWTGSSSSSMCILEGISTIHISEFYQQGSSTEVTLTLKDIVNPLSSTKTQPITIQIDGITSASTKWASLYSSNEYAENLRITATTGSIIVYEFKSIGSSRTFDLGSYRLSFGLTSKIPSSGLIELNFSEDFDFSHMNVADFSCIFSSGLSTQQTNCQYFANNNTIIFELGPQQSLSANSRVTVVLNGVRNPRSLRPTSALSISSYLESRTAPIDEIKSTHDQAILSVTMATLRELSVLSINPASFYVGRITSYTVSLLVDIPIFNGDILLIDFGEIKISTESSSEVICIGLKQLPTSISCSVANNSVSISFSNSIQVSTTIAFSISSLKNPTSSIFINTPIQLNLSDQGIYGISSTSYSSVPNRDSQSGYDAAPLNFLEVVPESDSVGAETTYSITFGTPIPILADSHRLNVTLSSEISMSPSQDAFGCYMLIKSITPSTPATCSYSKSTNSVEIIDFFPTSSARTRILSNQSDIPEGSTLQIRITGLKNKVKSGKFSNSSAGQFNLQITQHASSNSNVIILAESSVIPTVEFLCDSSCSTCSGTAYDCTSCDSDKLLQIDSKRCIDSCGYLYARVGNSCKRCTLMERDPNCVECSSSDLSECVKCDSKYVLSSSVLTSTGICELISTSNDPETNFVYDSQWNLPIISLYLIITGVFTSARRCYSIKSLRVGVVLLVLWSAIESLTLIVFTIKVILLPSTESVFIVCVVLLAYVILHGVFSVRLNRSLLQDGGFMLYQPNYDTIKFIQVAFRFNNVKAILAYRSRLSFIRDIYCIPFTNAMHLQAVVRQALFGSLSVSLLLILFNSWVMYFTYNYHIVLLPPFFFIEFQIFHVSLAILIMLLLFSKDKSPHSLVQVLAPASEELTAGVPSTVAGHALSYKQPQLDITQKSTSFITYATKKGNGGNEEVPNISGTGVHIRSSEIIPQQNQSISGVAGESMIGLVGRNQKKRNEDEDDKNNGERKSSQQFQLRYLCSTTLTPQAAQTHAVNQSNISLTQDGNLSNCSSNQDLRIIPRFSSSQSSISPSSVNSGLNTPVKKGVHANRFVKLPHCLSGQESDLFVDNNNNNNEESNFQADPVQLQTAQFDKGSPKKQSVKKPKHTVDSSSSHQFVPFSDGVSQQQNFIISSSTSSIRISQQQSCDESEHQFTIKIEDIQAEVKSRPSRSRKHHQKSMTIELEASTSSAKKKQSPEKSEEQCSEKYTESTEKDRDSNEEIEAPVVSTAKALPETSQLNQFLILNNNSNRMIRSPGNSTRLKSAYSNSSPQSHGTPQLGRVELKNSRQLQKQYQQEQRNNEEEDILANVKQNQQGNNQQVRQNNHIAVPVPQQLWSFSQNKEAPSSSKQCVSQFDYPGEERQQTDTAVSPHTTIPLHDPSGSLLLPNRPGNMKPSANQFHES